MVMIFRSALLIFDNAAYSVVVLPEPVGPGHQDNAVRQIEHLLPDVAVPLGHAQVFQTQDGVAAVENAQHHRLAVDHRNHADAQVDFAPRDLQPDAPVLRQAVFRRCPDG